MSGRLSFLQMRDGWRQWIRDEIPMHYRPSRFFDRGSDYMESAMLNHEKRMHELGYTLLSHHDEITGRGVAFYIDGTVVFEKKLERANSHQNLTHILG